MAWKNWGFIGESVRRSSVQESFVSRDCTPSPALLRFCRKTTPNKQRAVKPYKTAMNWAQVTQKKQQQAQVNVIIIYFYIYAYISTF